MGWAAFDTGAGFAGPAVKAGVAGCAGVEAEGACGSGCCAITAPGAAKAQARTREKIEPQRTHALGMHENSRVVIALHRQEKESWFGWRPAKGIGWLPIHYAIGRATLSLFRRCDHARQYRNVMTLFLHGPAERSDESLRTAPPSGAPGVLAPTSIKPRVPTAEGGTGTIRRCGAGIASFVFRRGIDAAPILA
ncbi:hypothetical protein [Roseixanthobacter pseudopolyaromaticivorans]|uniref:hypothetical protein n=1 Tax=Xanthobacteraceae TaxID=335928 RepID=UPI00372B7C24